MHILHKKKLIIAYSKLSKRRLSSLLLKACSHLYTIQSNDLTMFLQPYLKVFWVMAEIKGREILGPMQNKV